MNTLVRQGAHVATVDGSATEYTDGHVVVTDGLITAGADSRLRGCTRSDLGIQVTPNVLSSRTDRRELNPPRWRR